MGTTRISMKQIPVPPGPLSLSELGRDFPHLLGGPDSPVYGKKGIYDPPVEGLLRPAGFLRRWLAFAMDMPGIAACTAASVRGAQAMAILYPSLLKGTAGGCQPWWMGCALALPWIVWFVLPERFLGYSPGKFVCGVRPTDAYGRRPGLVRSFFRWTYLVEA